MKKINQILLTAFIAASLVFSNLCFANVASADQAWKVNSEKRTTQVLYNLFKALRTGDTDTLKRLFSGDMYEKNKILLEQNAEYPDYLRAHYQGAIFTITEIKPRGQNVTAGFRISFPDGKKEDVYLQLTKRNNAAQGSTTALQSTSNQWSIVNQVVNN